ncbi:hypothetical protein [Vibrio crassostreae]|uniref:beta-sandwich lipoprotein n=1 Tax=Vibrio crassostreae TaxID=246167 RepID=UPI001B31065A|nr:hypothetical protein [Vibrio crassostreae]
MFFNKVSAISVIASSLLLTGCQPEKTHTDSNSTSSYKSSQSISGSSSNSGHTMFAGHARNTANTPRIAFYNQITGKYVMFIEGECSIDAMGISYEVTCLAGKDSLGNPEYIKHYMEQSSDIIPVVQPRKTQKRVPKKPMALRSGGREVNSFSMFKPQTDVPETPMIFRKESMITGY